MAANTIQEKVHEVVGRVLSDPAFAAEIQQAGLAAVRSGAGSAEWNKYFEYFAHTPGALARMGDSLGAADCTCNSATWTTLSTAVTPVPTCCGATTTTTTSG